MAASTITRTTWTDDTGTPASPNGDGTTINNAQLQLIYDKVDQLMSGSGSYTTLTLGGLLVAEGFGVHTFSAGGTGANLLATRNTTAGVGNYAGFRVGNNSSASLGVLYGFSSTYTSTGLYYASGVTLESTGSGGLVIAATNASGTLRMQAGGSERVVIGSASYAEIKGAYSTTPAAVSGLGIGTQAAADRVQLIYGDGTGYKLHIGTVSGGSFVARLTVDDRGWTQGPTQPGFLAYNSSDDTGVTNGATVDFDTEVYDDGADFATDTFTAPITGRYLLAGAIYVTNTTGSAQDVEVRVVTSNRSYRGVKVDNVANNDTACLSFSVIADLDTSDTAYVVAGVTGGGTVTVHSTVADGIGGTTVLSYFSGRLLV